MDRTTLGSLVWTLSTRWRTEVDRVTTPLGLTHAQYSALLTLTALTRRGAKPTQRALADKLSVSAIYASKLLRALEGQGLITRSQKIQYAVEARVQLLRRQGLTEIIDDGHDVLLSGTENSNDDCKDGVPSASKAQSALRSKTLTECRKISNVNKTHPSAMNKSHIRRTVAIGMPRSVKRPAIRVE